MKMGPTGCSEKSVTDYQSTLGNIPHQLRSQSNSSTADFHSRTVHLDIIEVFYSPTDAQENCFKRNIKIYIKTAPTCFGVITIIRERAI
jgi:hypothetical protein